MNERIQEVADSFRSFDSLYLKLVETNDPTLFQFCLDNDGIWKRLELKWMLDVYEKEEQYERCQILKEFMKEYYIANDETQNKLNDSLSKLK